MCSTEFTEKPKAHGPEPAPVEGRRRPPADHEQKPPMHHQLDHKQRHQEIPASFCWHSLVLVVWLVLVLVFHRDSRLMVHRHFQADHPKSTARIRGALVLNLFNLNLVDSTKVAILGNSAGGFTAINSLCEGDLFKVAICKYPVLSLIHI